MWAECTCGHEEDEHDVNGCWGRGEQPGELPDQPLPVCLCVHYEENDPYWDDNLDWTPDD